jgi:mRNA interferase MazF
MRRGEIWWCDFEPSLGSEANNVRPAVIVSNNAIVTAAESLRRGVISVIPLTSNVTRVRSFQVLISGEASGLERDSKAQTEQIRALDIHRFVSLAGQAAPQIMQRIDRALRVQLSL